MQERRSQILRRRAQSCRRESEQVPVSEVDIHHPLAGLCSNASATQHISLINARAKVSDLISL